MPNLSIHLDELLSALQGLQRPVAELLQPGLSASAIRDLVGGLPITLTNEAKRLYSWKNGTSGITRRRIEEVCLFPNFYFPVTCSPKTGQGEARGI